MQDDGPARPARLARVSVRGSAINGERVALSGDDGVFVVDHLPPGSYQVYVTKPAYLPMYYGATRPARGPGTNVVVDGRKPVTDLKITLTRGAVVTGTVFDIEGQPAANVRVQMMTVTTVDGERVLTNASVSGTTLTDDRGTFRVYGVRSGTYVMLANPQTSTNTEIRQLSDQEMRAAIAEGAAGVKAAAMPADRIIAPGPAGSAAGAALAGHRGQLFAGLLPGHGQRTGCIGVRCHGRSGDRQHQHPDVARPCRPHRGRRDRSGRAGHDRSPAGVPATHQQFFAVDSVDADVRGRPVSGGWQWRPAPMFFPCVTHRPSVVRVAVLHRVHRQRIGRAKRSS